ncbi:MAG: glycosyltransferase [Dysgonomonas sp.]
MKIFQVITVSEYGGAQSVVASILEEFGKDTNNQLYVLYGGEGEAWQQLGPHIKRLRLCKHRKQISLQDLFLLFRLYYYRLKYRPDIVHLHSSKMGLLGRIAFNKKSIVYTVHGFDSIRKAFRKYLILEKLFKNRAASIVAVSKYDVDCLNEEGIHSNVKMIYNGLQDYSKKELVTEGLELPIQSQLEAIRIEYQKVIMCISRISKQKKFDLFLEISDKMPQNAFVWIGNKDKVDDLSSNVYCLGECHSAHRCLNYADIFILPSNYEGMPVSVIEALSYGKPVVASAVGGLTEMLDGKNGFAVKNDASSFADGINYTLSSDAVYAAMSANARKAYLGNFTIEKMISGYKEIYDDIYFKRNS